MRFPLNRRFRNLDRIGKSDVDFEEMSERIKNEMNKNRPQLHGESNSIH